MIPFAPGEDGITRGIVSNRVRAHHIGLKGLAWQVPYSFKATYSSPINTMAKYNITEKKEKEAAYRSLVSPRMMDEMQEKILQIIVMQKKYRDKE